jgi:topoisomerase-4 subunit A
MLVTPLAQLPQMARGKGNKIINVPSKLLNSGDEVIVAMALVGPKNTLVVHAGRKYKTMKASELDHYAAERGRRGLKLPRGYQNVDALDVE